MVRTLTRWSVIAALLSLLAPALFVIFRAAGLSYGLAGFLTAVIAIPAVHYVVHALAQNIEKTSRCSQLFLATWMALCLWAGYQLAHMSVFMLDAENVAFAFHSTLRPMDDPAMEKPFFVKHNCFTSYVVGAHLAAQGVENIYDPSLYRNPAHETEIHRRIGDTLTIDRYQYPPPFLLLPRMLLALSHDFFQVRAYWFGFSLLAIFLTVGTLAHWLGGLGFHAYFFALPLILIAPVTLGSLQIGNIHFLIICLSVFAMWAFEKRWNVLGGACLGFAIVSKLFPGVLLAYLLIRRRREAVTWTLAAMLAFCLATVAVFGMQPFDAFLHYQLPRLANGEAFSFMTVSIRALTANFSAMSVAYKLDKLGLLFGMNPAHVAAAITWVYSAVLVLTIILVSVKDGKPRSDDLAGDQHNRRLTLARTWLVLLVLGQMRNPFLPWGYPNPAILWLLALLVPVRTRSPWRIGLWLLVWLAFAVNVPLPVGPTTAAFDLWYTLAGTLVVVALCLTIVLRRRRTPFAFPCIPVPPSHQSSQPPT